MVDDPEQSPLLDGPRDDPDTVFSHALDRELEKITSFYDLKEPEVFGEVDELLKDEEAYEVDHERVDGENGNHFFQRKSVSGRDRRHSDTFREWGLGKRRRTSTSERQLERIQSGGSSDEEPSENTALHQTKSRDSTNIVPEYHRDTLDSNKIKGGKTNSALEDVSDAALSIAYSQGATLKKRMISLYVSLCELRSFAQLNKTGFAKVLKKYDKTLDRNLRPKYLKETVEVQYTFKQETTNRMNDKIAQIEQLYANLNTGGNIDHAKRELRLDLREHVVWERNTVWRDMIGIERKAQAANLGVRRTMLGVDDDHKQGDAGEGQPLTKEVETPIGRYTLPKFILQPTLWYLIVIFAIFMVLLFVPIMELPEQQNCLAMVVFVSLLWATEVSLRSSTPAVERGKLTSTRLFPCSSPHSSCLS